MRQDCPVHASLLCHRTYGGVRFSAALLFIPPSLRCFYANSTPPINYSIHLHELYDTQLFRLLSCAGVAHTHKKSWKRRRCGAPFGPSMIHPARRPRPKDFLDCRFAQINHTMSSPPTVWGNITSHVLGPFETNDFHRNFTWKN